ncbi:6294_t:CDS:2 [Paraglomus brasilianum]|uniref:6294_t:CDS:1 n=1 Tax=Paraglomus brasilianum TaxID=144538 RepID=A0A9N9B3P7_9GLOM|nr:6294_t:CDS:2 [Paraglomus brasilianum]
MEKIRWDKRRSEPNRINILKKITAVFFYGCLIAYLCWMIYELYRSEKTLIYSRTNIDGLPSPDIIFGSEYKFDTSCLLIQYDGKISQSECQSYLSSPSYDPDRNMWIKKFVAPNFTYPDPSTHYYNRDVIRRIDFEFSINSTFYPTDWDANMWAILFDRESNVVSENGPHSMSVASDVDSTIYSNIYTLGKGQHNVLKIERTIHKFIIPSVQNLIIGRPHFATLPMLSSTYATYPLVNVNSSVYARVSVEPSSYMVNTEIEKSNMTLLNVLSALGGMYSLIVALYGLLYGDRAIEPWGWVQHIQLKYIGCGFRKLVIEELSRIAYWATDRSKKSREEKNEQENTINKDIESAEQSTVIGDEEENTIGVNKKEDTDGENEEEWTIEKLHCKFKSMQEALENMQKQQEALEKLPERQKALENFLQDYVVDMKFYIKHKDKGTDSNN